MAEGDTILRAARRIETALRGEEISATAPGPRGRAAGIERLDGRRLDMVEAKGKHLLLRFGDLTLHSHLGMNGSWHVYKRGAAWRKSSAGAWAALRGSECEAVQFGGPTLRVLPTSRLARDPRLAHLGPDILASKLDLAGAVLSLRSNPTLELGDALLDQSLIAGIGNVFKSEACFAAGVDPWRRIEELPDSELERVLLAAREAMMRSAAHGRAGAAVYKRTRRPCPACGRPIASAGQGDANRTTYWCPSCQAR